MKPITVFVLALAPFLSLTDAAHGAPAGSDAARHRRVAAVGADSPGSTWNQRAAKRQDDGPPSLISVSLPIADPSSTTDPGTTPSSSSTDPGTTPSSTDPGTTSTSTDPGTTSSSSSDAPVSTLTDSSTSAPPPDNGSDSGSSSPTSTSDPVDTPSSSSTSPTDTPTSTTTSTDPPPDTSATTTTTDTPLVIIPTSTTPPPDPPTSTTTPPDPPTSTTPPPGTPTSTPDPSTGTTDSCGPLGLGCVVAGVTSDAGSAISNLTDFITITETTTATDTGTDAPPPPPSATTTTTTTDDPLPPPPTTTTTTPNGPIATDTGTGIGTGIITTTSSNIVSIVTNLFPTTSLTDNSGVITTLVDLATSKASISIDSQYQFITASSFLVEPTTTTSGTVTITNPDAAPTTQSLLTNSVGGAVTLTAPVIPSSIPMFITPPADSNPVPLGTDLPGYTEISILFQMTASWLWVLQSPDTAAQILAYLPPVIQSSLGCSDSDNCIRTVMLKAFEPANLQSPSDLMTMYVGQLKSDLVDTLASMIRDPTSLFYNTGDSVANSVAKNVVMSFNIATLSGVSNQNGSNQPSSSTTTKLDNSRRNAIIGVTSTFGVVALVVIVWWMMKSYRARQEAAHKRLSYTNEKTYGTAGEGAGLGGGYGRADSPPMLQNPFLSERERQDEARGIRRNSFYAIGPDDASLEEETFDYMSHRSSQGGMSGLGGGGGGHGLRRETSGGSGGRAAAAGWGGQATGVNPDRLSPSGSYSNHPYARRPVVGQPISQPILRESSMGNW